MVETNFEEWVLSYSLFRAIHEKKLERPWGDKHIKQITSNINNQCGLN